MSTINLAGPSYTLRSGADVQRVVGWMPVRVESGQGKGGAQAFLKQQPGLTLKATLPYPVRGLEMAKGKLYAVAGSTVYKIESDWTFAEVGTVQSSSGAVEMAVNNTQVFIAQGSYGDILDLDTQTVAAMVDDAWPGSLLVDVIDGYGIYSNPGSPQFSISALEDFSQVDGLDFAAANGSAGPIVGFIVTHRQILFLKENTGEVWYDSGNADFPLSRNDGANIEAGLLAARSLRKLAGTPMWLGRNEEGAAVVLRLSGYTPDRISSHALEEALSGLSSEQLEAATAFTYQQEGLGFYVLNVPGLDTTWVYEVASNWWHERAEWVDGAFQQWRPNCHAYAYGENVVGDASGKLYALDPSAGSNAGDVLIRDRITPHAAVPSLARRRFGSLQVDCSVGMAGSGEDPKLMMRYSNDGGRNWGDWRYLSLGKIGETLTRVRATMLGSARDRVWHFRVTDDIQCDLLAAVVDEL